MVLRRFVKGEFKVAFTEHPEVHGGGRVEGAACQQHHARSHPRDVKATGQMHVGDGLATVRN